MSATIAPPRPTRRLASDCPSPALPGAGSTRRDSSRRPALRLIASTGGRGSGPSGAPLSPAPRPQIGSRPARHLQLVTTGTTMAVTKARQVADDAAQGGPQRPIPRAPRTVASHLDETPAPTAPRSPAASPTTVPPAGAASPLRPAEGMAPAAGVASPRRPGAPLPLRDRGPHPGTTERTRSGRRVAGAASRPGLPRGASTPARQEGSWTATIGSTTEAGGAASDSRSADRSVGRAARLAPNHPAVRSAGLRSRRGSALSTPGARSAQELPASEQHRPLRSADPRALPLPVRRFIAALSTCLVAIVLVSAGLVVSSVGSTEPTRTTTTVVQPGQSLWEVASATGSPDVAQTVATIVELNDLDSSTIHAGETLTIPVH